ncbi:MAG: flagellar hook-basal body complex protein FliE [Pseudomonadota bacterium]
MTFETSVAAALYTSLKPEAGPAVAINAERAGGAGQSFSDALAEAARALGGTLRRGETMANAAVSGTGDMQSLVEAMTAAEMAVETAVVMRDRVVEAYQEILRMPV